MRSLSVELDPEQYPRPAGVVEWHRAQHLGPHCESFQIKCDPLYYRRVQGIESGCDVLNTTLRCVAIKLGLRMLATCISTSTCRRRLGERDVPVKVRLEVDWQPDRYQLSQGLASLLGMELETRARVIEVRTRGTAVPVMPGNAGRLYASSVACVWARVDSQSASGVLLPPGAAVNVIPLHLLAGGMVLREALQMPDPRRPYSRHVQCTAEGAVRGGQL